MAITKAEIARIDNESELEQQYAEFETQLYAELVPLQNSLSKMPLSTDVPNLEQHMTYVESWRERVARRLSLVSCFTQTAKGDKFLLIKSKSTTDTDRVAYQNRIIAQMKSDETYLENLIDCIDSRVNVVKKLVNVEVEVGGRRQHY